MSRKSALKRQITTERSLDPLDEDGDRGYDILIGAAGNTSVDSTTYKQPMLWDMYNNKALDVDVYGGRRITYSNKYEKFQQLELINPRLGMALIKFGLRLRGKEYKLFVDQQSGIDKEAQRSIIQDSNQLTKNLRLQNVFASAGRLLGRDGTVPILTSADKRRGTGEGITKIDFMPMSHTTLLPPDVKPLSGFQNEEQLWEWAAMVGEVTQVIINERRQAPSFYYKTNINPLTDRVILLRLMHEGHECRDIYQRNTIGIYGISLMELVEPTAKKLEDMVWGIAKALGRYGYSRYHIDDTLYADLIKTGGSTLTLKQAMKRVQAELAALKSMKPDQDIVTVGKQIKELGALAGNITGVISLKESFEKDISYGFLETEAGSNKSKGSTFASSNVADEDTSRVIEATRTSMVDEFVKIYRRHAMLIGYNEDEANSIQIELQPINDPQVTLQDLAELAQLYPDAISIGQILELKGINLPPRQIIDNQPISPHTPTDTAPTENPVLDQNNYTASAASGGFVPRNPKNYDTADENATWAAPTLKDFGLTSWPTDEGSRMKIASCFAYAMNLDSFGGLKLPHHRTDGTVVWAGVKNAMSRLSQTQGLGDKKDAVEAHLKAHYKDFNKDVPA